MNVISVGLLAKDDYYFSIKNDYCDIIMNSVTFAIHCKDFRLVENLRTARDS